MKELEIMAAIAGGYSLLLLLLALAIFGSQLLIATTTSRPEDAEYTNFKQALQGEPDFFRLNSLILAASLVIVAICHFS